MLRGFATVNVLGIMYNPHYLDMLRADGPA
jgi:hypothetical protein